MQTPLPLIDDFHSIVTQKRPLIDTRSPIEFAKGSFPNTINLPLMSDKERESVGIAYKRQGEDAALKLGYELVSGKVRQERIEAWVEFLRANPEAYLFCWRGGRRSQIAQRWIYESSKIIVPRLKGGYKAFRNYLIQESINLVQNKKILIIGGRTGSGKTLLLKQIDEAIDLEGLARHRGSAFGRYALPQPSQIDFENALAYALIRHDAKGFKRIIFEDESRNIGQRYIAPEIFGELQKAPVILLETPLKERIEILYKDYILYAQNEYDEALKRGESAHSWIDTMRHNFQRIRKRLGDERTRRLSSLLEAAWRKQLLSGDREDHKIWIEALLKEYYDPMYDYQIDQKRDRIIFRGSAKEILNFLKERPSI